MGVPYPSLSASSVVDASQLNANFAALAGMTRGLTTNNLASAAGLVSSQLADRFGSCTIKIPLLDFTSGADLRSPADFTVPSTATDNGTEVDRFYLQLRTGKAAYLCAAKIKAISTTQATTAWTKLWLTKNGVLLGGAGRNIDTTNPINLRNSNFMDVPICSLVNDDYLGIGLGRSDTSGNPTARGLSLFLTFKFELGA